MNLKDYRFFSKNCADKFTFSHGREDAVKEIDTKLHSDEFDSEA